MDEEDVLLNVHPSSSPEADVDLFNGSGSGLEYLEVGVPLYRAALEGDWTSANKILVQRPNLARARIGKWRETPLHIGAAAKREKFVKKLVEFMQEDDLALQNTKSNTALCFAAASGNVEIARAMVDKNSSLPYIRGNQGMTPLYMASLLGHTSMVYFLLSVTDFNRLTQLECFGLLITSINSDLFDVALVMLEDNPNLALLQDRDGKAALHFLARKCLKPNTVQLRLLPKCLTGENKNPTKHDQALELVRKLWGEMIKNKYNDISLNLIGSPSQFIFDAAEVGNIEFIAILIGAYPDLIWKVNKDGVSIFHVAVEKRHALVFSMIYEIGAIKDLLATYTDKKGNNMLHLASMNPPFGSLDKISGAALQMQRELLWYKEVENVVPLQFRESKNSDNKTPRSLFAETHENLRKEGEKWMRSTSNSCSVVAALIATVAFTAGFTVPGGNDQTKGTPIFQRNPIFVVFTIADAISLFASSMAMLMFLGILTSRYSQKDFLEKLPRRLMVGMSSLFLSIASMMVAFASTFFIMFTDGTWIWVLFPVLVALLLAIPVILFGFQQFSLLLDIYRSTYKTRYLFRSRKHRVFKRLIS